MTEQSRKILDEMQVRKSKKQKASPSIPFSSLSKNTKHTRFRCSGGRARDTVLDEANIALLRDGALRYIAALD